MQARVESCSGSPDPRIIRQKLDDDERKKIKKRNFRITIAVILAVGFIILVVAMVLAGLYGSLVASNTGIQTFMQSCTTIACDKSKNLNCIDSICLCGLSGNYWNGYTCAATP
jgi:hypothetical protein